MHTPAWMCKRALSYGGTRGRTSAVAAESSALATDLLYPAGPLLTRAVPLQVSIYTW